MLSWFKPSSLPFTYTSPFQDPNLKNVPWMLNSKFFEKLNSPSKHLTDGEPNIYQYDKKAH